MNQTLGPAQQPASSELAAALGACRRAFVATAVFSGMSNILMLTGALFMLEVYDRILQAEACRRWLRCSFWWPVYMPPKG